METRRPRETAVEAGQSESRGDSGAQCRRAAHANAARSRDGRRLFTSKSPLLAAALGGTLLLFPSAAAAADVSLVRERRVEVPAEVVRESLAALAERLNGRDAKAAYKAERSLIRAGGLSVPVVLPYLRNWKAPAFRRALSVLSQISWGGVDRAAKRQAADAAVRGLYMVNLRGQRFPESLLAEKALLGIGGEALPALAGLVRGEDDIGKWLGLTVLERVRWGRMPYARVREVVKALRCVECCSRHGELRKSAERVLGKIRNVYGISRVEGDSERDTGHLGAAGSKSPGSSASEGGTLDTGGEMGEGAYGQRKAA